MIGGLFRMERAGAGRSGGGSPGTVWIDCPYPVVAAGLAGAFGEHVRVHLGRSAPADGVVPSCAIFDPDGAEGLHKGIQRIRGVSPEIPILIFSLHVDLPLIRTALRFGARGFIHSGMELDQVARAAEVAARGEVVVPRKLLERLVVNEEPPNLDDLTARQREILQLVAKGFRNAEIANTLFLSESTVKQHLRATYKILGVSDRKEAARFVPKITGEPSTRR